MTGPRRRGAAGTPPPTAQPPGAATSDGPLRLPESGTAEEILAQLGLAAAAPPPSAAPSSRLPQPPPPPSSPDPSDPSDRSDRVYSFADSLDQRARADEAANAPREQAESWVVFELAGESYGLPVGAVHEILRVGTLTRVPHTPKPVRGITNRRGRVLAVVDLRVRLGLPPAEIGPRSRILVVDSRKRTLGLLVDAALQVVKLLPSALEAPPPDVMTERSDYIAGVYHLGEQLIIALALDLVLLIHDESAARPSAAATRSGLPPQPGLPGGP